MHYCKMSISTLKGVLYMHMLIVLQFISHGARRWPGEMYKLVTDIFETTEVRQIHLIAKRNS